MFPSLTVCTARIVACMLVAGTSLVNAQVTPVVHQSSVSSLGGTRYLADQSSGRASGGAGNKGADDHKMGEEQVIISPQVIKIAGINSPDRDNTPLVSADGNILFFNSTRQGDRPWAKFNPIKNRYDDDIYFSIRKSQDGAGEEWSEPVNIGAQLNSSEDDGIVAISPDGQSLYYNSLKRGWEADGGPFYRTRLSGTNWTDVKGLGGGITEFFKTREPGNRYRIYGGSISSDGRDFFFATTVHSRTGNHEIWASHFNGKEWSYPVNLGPEINHGGGSYAPCIAADGKTLYYTASGVAAGEGGDDIYVSFLKDGVWQKPFNMGPPINTAGDDSFISIAASGEKAYLSRTISGDNEDIYMAPIPLISRPSSVILVSGMVTDKASGKAIEATIVIEDLKTGQKIFNANSNSISGHYTTVLRPGHDYGISISAPGYVFLSARYTVPDNVSYDKLSQDFQIQKMEQGQKFVANNIFFDYNTAELSLESRPELDRLVEMMKEYPQLKLSVDGHTDNVGSVDYNYQLSLKRAEAVKDYIISNGGVDASRIATQGFGFSKPVAPNRTEQGRKQNRRSEFTILSM